MVSLSYSLRCVVFHNIAAAPSPFTAGIHVDRTPQQLEETLRFLTARYRPVSLQDVLTDCDGRGLPTGALLVTFDDAYASVAEIAAPLCRQFRVPAVFFINAAFLDNKRLAPDNLVCYVVHVHGMSMVNKAIRKVLGDRAAEVNTLAEIFGVLFPSLTLLSRQAFLETLLKLAGIDEGSVAKEASLYLTTEQLRGLRSYNFEIGNHTYTHMHCRSLIPDDVVTEIDLNKSKLEAKSGRKVRSFSVPYGSSKDLSEDLTEHLRQTGHEAVFLSESVANSSSPNRFRLDRIGSQAKSNGALFVEIELMPRLRAVRNQLFSTAR